MLPIKYSNIFCLCPFLHHRPDSNSFLRAFTRDKCQNKQVGTGWVLGWGYSLHSMLEYIEKTGNDPKDLLDQYVVDSKGNPLPAIMMEETSHSVWVNSEALRLAGITDDVVDAHGSLYMRNSNGELNGILFENAGKFGVTILHINSKSCLYFFLCLGIEIMRKASDPVDYPDFQEQAYQGLLWDGLFLLAKNGITSSVDARVFWMEEMDQVWNRVYDEGKLTARISMSLWAYPELDDDTQLADLKALYDVVDGSLLRTNQIKLYMDGLLESR